MERRFASIWFRHLTTDWLALRQPALRNMPFVLAEPVHGRMVITAANTLAETQGIHAGMVVADAKAAIPDLQVIDYPPGLIEKLLEALGLWCIRYTPAVAVAPPDGLILDTSGCTHLWGGERPYLKEIVTRLRDRGYDVRMAIADTIGTARAIAYYGKDAPIISSGAEWDALSPLPPAALRLESDTVHRLRKLGLRTIGSFMSMPRTALRRRFGPELVERLEQALAQKDEYIQPLRPIPPYTERIPCLDPIRTATGIEIAIQRLLEMLCKRLANEGKGLRQATLYCHRVDGKMVQVAIRTSRPTAHVPHIFKLFVLKIPQIEPALGIELFIIEADKVEDADPVQNALWGGVPGPEDTALTELLDKLAGKTGILRVSRYLPDEHHWPERSFRLASSIGENPTTTWCEDRPRPTRLLAKPEPIEVSAPVPDYPPMLFRYKGEVHPIRKADGPERIEREWWMDKGEHRDYYQVEDDGGRRYWLFRSGHYTDGQPQRWFLHGFFA
ncbi:Y-family DNA polymerase [Parapedobacter indicus]|uniref:Protein ImuB n=1 Tax=Parapedobacter indicus TaxID=1477437 RepID=A0A1I3MWK7_9SPHI|nr:DNA polymerase Y family protein [Parapedobacter indicus]PPL00801.1 protein ImuB [Parapedobacter indicus]SFJ01312.1 protein ImuB [Parapedobacter indicus]